MNPTSGRLDIEGDARRVIDIVRTEVDLVMAQIGCARLGALDGGCLAHNVIAQAAQRTGTRS